MTLKMKRYYMAMLLFTFTFLVAHGQKVTGVIKGEDGVPLSGATVLEKGTTNGVVADFDGNYEIDGLSANSVLVFSYVGYVAKEVPVGSNSVLNITLNINASLLDEVVVIGYGTQKKSELTTSIASVSGEQISEIPVADIGQALQGRAAGVQITNSSTPGGRTLIRVRGLSTISNGDPLIVVDGVFVENRFASVINSIDPASIEKVDILKDAAATAVYGSRGANGVIIITTKKAKRGRAEFNFSTFSGIQFNNNRFDVLNTEQYLRYLREIAVNPSNPEGERAVARIILNPAFDGNGVDTDWQDEAFRSAQMRNYTFNASSGNDKGRFNFGFSAFDQDGIYIDTNFQRYTFNINSDVKVFDGFKVGQNFSYGFNQTILPETEGGRQILQNALAAPPYIPVRNEEGVFGSTDFGTDGTNARNVVRISATNDNLNRTHTLFGSLFAEFKFLKDFTLRSQYSLSTGFINRDNIRRAFQTTGELGLDLTTIFKNRSQYLTRQLTNTLSYNKSIGKSNLSVALVSEQVQSNFRSVSGTLITNLSSQIEELGLDESQATSTSFSNPDELISYVGRLNYDFDDKYLLQLSIRRDRSSRFFEDQQIGWFPGVSVGWVASKEAFLQNTIINNLKFKASYGVTGNNFTSRFNGFEPGITTDFIFPIGGSAQSGAGPDGAFNLDLRWEEAIKQNYGFELGLWNNKLTFEVDYFINDSEELLIPEPQAPSAGVLGNFVDRNVGDIRVEGVEFTVAYNDNEGDFKWNAWANISTAESTVTSFGTGNDQILRGFLGQAFTDRLSRISVGDPLYHFFGLISEGVYADDQEVIDHLGNESLGGGGDAAEGIQFRGGDVRFTDVNGDGRITLDDRTIIGDPNPDFTYSVNLGASYKNFDFSALVTGVQGVDVFNANIWYLENQQGINNFGTQVLRRWRTPGDITDIPRFRNVQNNPNNSPSTRFIEDGSYARLKNLVIGYSFPSDFLQSAFKGRVKRARLYGQAQNLLTITGYSGLDPEIEPLFQGGQIIEAIGIDRGVQPQPSSFLMGLQIGF